MHSQHTFGIRFSHNQPQSPVDQHLCIYLLQNSNPLTGVAFDFSKKKKWMSLKTHLLLNFLEK